MEGLIEREFCATIDNLHEVLGFLECELEKHDASMKVINILSIALEEMYANVALYAYPEGQGTCTISIWFEGDDVNVRLVDSGIEFNPLAKQDPDIHASAEERDIGGLGIYMVKETMDDCSYQRIDDKNIFTMRKGIK